MVFKNAATAFLRSPSRFALLEYPKGIDSQMRAHWSQDDSYFFSRFHGSAFFLRRHPPVKPLARIDSTVRRPV